ncbi:MAG: hypothetical protein P4L87_23740, partial [Formivibrio sp.]|nr:hypothetical protein [Formivibrio sp.]
MSQLSPPTPRAFDEILPRSGIAFDELHEANRSEIHATIALSDVPSMAARLVEQGCHLSSVFAEDRTADGSG